MSTKTLKIAFVILLTVNNIFAQNGEQITLTQCYDEATKANPLYSTKDLYSKINTLQVSNVKTAYLPKVTLNAQATYQSDITKVDIPIDKYMQKVFEPLVEAFPNLAEYLQSPPAMEIPSPKKDQYKATLDVNQVIYDGGITKLRKELEMSNLETDLQQVEVELYKIKERINKLYFAILLLQENRNTLQVMIDEIDKRLIILQSALRNGVTTQSNLDVLEAEKLKLQQKIIEIDINKTAALNGISILINRELSENTMVEIPNVEIANSQISRPENVLFELQSKKLDAATKLVSHKNYPMLYGFGQAGYGRPGFNMFSTTFDPFYIVGAKLSWNLWDWKQTSREKQIYSIQKEIITANKDAFEKNINMSLVNEKAKIDKYSEIINKDKEIIELRSRICKSSASKLENGIITSTDYITDLNAEMNAKISLKSHEIELIMSKINYNTTVGK